jgi:hypothetical protein
LPFVDQDSLDGGAGWATDLWARVQNASAIAAASSLMASLYASWEWASVALRAQEPRSGRPT